MSIQRKAFAICTLNILLNTFFWAAHWSIALQTLGLATSAALGQLLLSKFEAISRPDEKHTHFRILMDFSVHDFVEQRTERTETTATSWKRTGLSPLSTNWRNNCSAFAPLSSFKSSHCMSLYYGGPSYSKSASVRCHNTIFDSFSDTWLGTKLAIGLAAAHAPMAQFQEIMSRCLATNRCEYSQHLPTHHPIIKSTSVYLLSLHVQIFINGNDFHQPEQKKKPWLFDT